MNFAGMHMAQFTAGATARRTLLQLGFVPDFVLVLAAHTATNPNLLLWVNKGGYTDVDAVSTAASVMSQWLDADDHLLLTGTTGVVTRVTTGIKAYVGGETIAAAETIASNPVHPYSNGAFPAAGEITAAGIELPAAILTADALYIVLAFRQVANQKPSGL